MSRAVAVAIVHGTGDKEPTFADGMMQTLRERFPRHLPPEARADAKLALAPVYWAGPPHELEERVWKRVSAAGPMNHRTLRRFIFNVAGDTLAYQPSGSRKDLYLSVHRIMAGVFARLAEQAGPDAPLCVIGHSMGSIVAHNYLYDMQHETNLQATRPETTLERAETLALFCTYGSPIAIWRLRFGDDYKAIDFPGTALAGLYPNLKPRWLNIYDADDVLGYPIAGLTERYEELANAGYLEDREKSVGSFIKRWNPLSHKGYLRDKNSLDDLAGFIAEVWKGAYYETC